jgi:hypothetical protein
VRRVIINSKEPSLTLLSPAKAFYIPTMSDGRTWADAVQTGGGFTDSIKNFFTNKWVIIGILIVLVVIVLMWLGILTAKMPGSTAPAAGTYRARYAAEPWNAPSTPLEFGQQGTKTRNYMTPRDAQHLLSSAVNS